MKIEVIVDILKLLGYDAVKKGKLIQIKNFGKFSGEEALLIIRRELQLRQNKEVQR